MLFLAYVSWAPWAEDAIPWSLRVTAVLSHWPWKTQSCLIYQTTGFYSPVSHLGTLCETPLGTGGSERTRNLFARGLLRPVCEFAGAFFLCGPSSCPAGLLRVGGLGALAWGGTFPTVSPLKTAPHGGFGSPSFRKNSAPGPPSFRTSWPAAQRL